MAAAFNLSENFGRIEGALGGERRESSQSQFFAQCQECRVHDIGGAMLRQIFQRQPGDQFTVMLQQIDPACADDLALPYGVREQHLIAYSRNGWPFPRANLRHVFTRAHIDKLDHDHKSPKIDNQMNKWKADRPLAPDAHV